METLTAHLYSALSPAIFYCSSVRSMLTISPVNFSVISMFVGGMLCYNIKNKHLAYRLILFVALLAFTSHEMIQATKATDNHFKFLGISPKASTSEFQSAMRQVKGKYHPDNLQTGNTELFNKANDLTDAFSTHYSRKMELYFQYGDSFDLHSPYAPEKHDVEALAVSRFIQFIGNYLMLFLITILFFQNSAKRGLFQKVSLGMIFFFFATLDLVMDQSFELEQNQRGEETLELCDFIKKIFSIPHSIMPEVLLVWRLILVIIICTFYFYGLLFQPKEEEILIKKCEVYYKKLQQFLKHMQKDPQFKVSKEEVEVAWNLLETMRPSIDYINKNCGKKVSEGYFNFLHKILQNLLNIILFLIIGVNLFFKYKDSAMEWISNKPQYDY